MVVVVVWNRIPTQEIDKQDLPGVSVVIPARNEASNIEPLVESINSLVYPRQNLEVVIVDDASDDQTPQKLQEHTAQHPIIKWLTLNDPPFFGGSYKKRALTCGIETSQHPIIVTSDADCQFSPLWINHLAHAVKSNNLVMVSAPVVYNSSGPLASMLEMELACLVAVGAVSLHLGKPNMCNGANLAFTREAFFKVDGYQGFEHVVSGDDEFLLYKMNRQFPGRTGFIKNADAVVSTEPPKTWKELLHQRRRWGGKWKDHKSVSTRLLAFFVFFFHLIFATVLVMTLSGVYLWKLFMVQFLFKMLMEIWLITSVLSGFGKRIAWKWFLPMQLLYSFYVLLIGVAAQLRGFKWKNRQYQ